MALRQLHGGEGLASYSRESFTTVATNAGGAIGYKLRPVLQAQLSSGQGFTDLCSLGHALPDSATAVGPWDSISATGGSGRRVGLVQQAELIRATLEMDPSLSVPAILREAALLVGTEPEGPLLVQVCRARPLRTPCGLPPLCTPLHASARPFCALGRRGGCSIASRRRIVSRKASAGDHPHRSSPIQTAAATEAELARRAACTPWMAAITSRSRRRPHAASDYSCLHSSAASASVSPATAYCGQWPPQPHHRVLLLSLQPRI